MSVAAATLPGIYFRPDATPLATSDLPRMDVAGFVGIAACGPLDTPVAIEDPSHFRDIFGDDPPLAWDAERAGVRRALLGAAVTSFFGNGGRRCWVVRVAGRRDPPVLHRFVIPGLAAAPDFRPARARARSEGAWCEDLTVAAELQERPLPLLDHDLAQRRLTSDRRADPVVPGDLMRLRFPTADVVALVPAESVAGNRVDLAPGWWFGTEPPASSAVLLEIRRIDEAGPVAIAEPGSWSLATEGEIDISFAQLEEGAVRPGDLLELDFSGGEQALLAVTGALRHDGVAGTLLRPLDPTAALARAAGANVAAACLTFRLSVYCGQAQTDRLDGLGFLPAHPRYWGRLPTDAAYFADGVDAAQQWAAERATRPRRFALAGTQQAAVHLPLGMSRAATPAWRRGLDAEARSGARLQRDGLAELDWTDFFDPALRQLRPSSMVAASHHRRAVLGERLRGAHALLPIDEVSLIVMPDVVHRPWEQEPTTTPQPLIPPSLSVQQVDDELRLTWTEAQDEHGTMPRYRAQASDNPDFQGAVVIYEGEGLVAPAMSSSACQRRRFFRVRGERSGYAGPWSNNVAQWPPERIFELCEEQLPPAPYLSIPSSPPQEYLVWTEVPGETRYLVQQAADPGFGDASRLYEGEAYSVQLPIGGRDRQHYRVRASWENRDGPWSNTVSTMGGPGAQGWKLASPEDFDEDALVSAHHCLLRLCAARADVLALLALPDHYREADCLAYAQRLRELATLDGATSFGALFHPWTVVGTEPPRLAPADGAAAGLAARQASGPGAWISLANQPLQRVLGLDPILDAPGRAERCEARLNEIVPAPRGHLLLTAQTLSVGEALRPLSVRQLMSLVRRLAIREGSRHVFEPNGRALRRQVVGHFTRVLSELWRRGALAGSTASEAFRVTAGPRTTTSRDIDAGRFVVELRVAPSRPLEFLLIRLIAATDNESISVQET